jgi:hypothetical protein
LPVEGGWKRVESSPVKRSKTHVTNMFDCPLHIATSPNNTSTMLAESPASLVMSKLQESVPSTRFAVCAGSRWRHTPSPSATVWSSMRAASGPPAIEVLTTTPGAAKP